MIIKGQKINDRYQIIRMIGEGGMANVYLAHDTILDRNVAVKILRGDLADDEKFVRRFQREAISASSLSHPNIVEMYDVGEDDGKYFIVMEYIEGRTLKQLIKRRGLLTIHEVIDIMSQLASGMICAHDSYIIHRDLKPQNILILDDGRVKITDFGIAMALNSNELTQTNSVMGSVHYLPPEQANGTGATVKSDIYSLGILMFELITGKLPFKGENAVEIAIKQMKDNIPSVKNIDPDIPQSIENIILASCAKNPKNRYDSVREMYEDLSTALSDERKDELRLVYKFPENEVEETKPIPKITKNKEIKEEEKTVKKLNLPLIILSSIVGLFLLIWLIMVVIIPKVTKVPDIKIPDVSGLTIVDAEKQLLKVGLKVNSEVEERPHDSVDKNTVIETKPSKNRLVKKGKLITLVVSTGAKGITVENYIGKNYNETKAILEAYGIAVKEETKKVEELDNYEKNVILEQSVKVGTKLISGDIITFTIPEELIYPDFVKEKWALVDIEDFAKKYNVNLVIETIVNEDVTTGTIMSQSRQPGDEVLANTTLKVEVSKKGEKKPTEKPIVKPEPEVNPEGDNE